MAARVLLLGILFTEVLEPVYPAGLRISGVNAKNDAKTEGLESRTTILGNNAPLSVEIEPGGDIILGRKGITLSCLAGQGDEITWLREGVPAPPCGISRCVQRNNSLHFHKKKNSVPQKRKGREGNETSIKHNKKVEYRCVARTSYGASIRSSPTFLYNAELAHSFSESPEDLTIRAGEVARLSCLIDSVPFPPNITWLHDEKVLPISHNSTKYSIIPPGVLYISATKLSDAGSYRCVATNDCLNKTRKSKEAKLTVLSKSDTESVRALVSLFPQISYNYTIKRGSNLRLVCAASGYPPPTVTWTFSSKDLDNDEASVVLQNSTTGISLLSLTNITTAHAGVYSCSAKTATNDSLEYQNIAVDVLVPPTFLETPEDRTCPNGKTARLKCQAEGYPTPVIYWLKDSQTLTIIGRKTVYDKEFNMKELAIAATVPSDSGIYQCVAVNAAGEAWAAGRLQVNTSRKSPDTTTALKCYPLSPVKIRISWEPPKSLSATSITAYTVHYSPVDGGKEEVSPPEPGNSTYIEVTKQLAPFTNYSFYVRVWNNHGASDQSETINCSTAPSVPKAIPEMVLAINASTKLSVSWKPLTKWEAQGVVTEYKLQWRVFEHPSIRVEYFPVTVEKYMLNDLNAGERYELRVLARTEQGWPNLSESELGWTNITMPMDKSRQTVDHNLAEVQIITLNSSAIKVKWFVKDNASFDSWKIDCENGNGESISTAYLYSNSTQHVFANLESNVSYVIELCAVNLKKAVHCQTRRVNMKGSSLNIVPTSLEAEPVSATAINLTWQVSDTRNSSSFQVCYYAVHFPNEPHKCINVNTINVTIDRLKPFMLYQFKVRTLQKGSDLTENPYSETVECYTMEDVPGKIEGVNWFLMNSTNVRIAWKEPNTVNGVVQKYYVAYSTDLGEPITNWENVTVVGNKTMASLTGLMPGKRYFVRVRAATHAGYGYPSEPIMIMTGGRGATEVPSSSDVQKPPPTMKSDQSLGVIMGVSFSIIFVAICLCSMYCRQKCEMSRSLHESAQPIKNRTILRNGNACCIERSSPSSCQPPASCNEIELAVLCPSTPMTVNPLCDTKGGHSNSMDDFCTKEPLLASKRIMDDHNILHITENPQYKPGESLDLSKAESQDLDNTQLTLVSCIVGDSEESLNNNLGCLERETLSDKIAPTVLPMLGPNG